MASMYAVIADKACKFPIVDPIVDLDRSSEENLSVHSSRTNGVVNIIYDLFNTANSDSNRIRYEDYLSFLKDKLVTNLTLMNNTYKVFVDIVIYDESKKVIEEGIKIHEITASDLVKLYDVDSSSELKYVFNKKFHCVIPCNVANSNVKTFGINARQKVPKYVRIRNISIRGEYKDPDNTNGIMKLNQTLIDTTISRISPTISDVKDKMIEVYNSAGTNLAVIDIGTGYPRSINIEINVTVDGFMVPFDEIEINKILVENEETLNPDPSPDPGPDSGPDPGGDDDEGSLFFAQYERCSKTDAQARVVVADADYKDDGTCYKLSEVQKDIPDIKVGEYVKYVESLVVLSL